MVIWTLVDRDGETTQVLYPVVVVSGTEHILYVRDASNPQGSTIPIIADQFGRDGYVPSAYEKILHNFKRFEVPYYRGPISRRL
jgi:hypothetical protein